MPQRFKITETLWTQSKQLMPELQCRRIHITIYALKERNSDTADVANIHFICHPRERIWIYATLKGQKNKPAAGGTTAAGHPGQVCNELLRYPDREKIGSQVVKCAIGKS